MYFKCKTNNESPYINGAVFRYGKKKVFLDRETTEWTYDKKAKVMDMWWSHLYIWDADKSERIAFPEADFYEKAEFVKFDVEDDAPKDYRVKMTEWSA